MKSYIYWLLTGGGNSLGCRSHLPMAVLSAAGFIGRRELPVLFGERKICSNPFPSPEINEARRFTVFCTPYLLSLNASIFFIFSPFCRSTGRKTWISLLFEPSLYLSSSSPSSSSAAAASSSPLST